jgi:hypothetical protein
VTRKVDPVLPNPLPRLHEFCVCRVRIGCALTTLESFDKFRAAESFMSRMAARQPGSYVVFSQMTRQVLAKVIRPSR